MSSVWSHHYFAFIFASCGVTWTNHQVMWTFVVNISIVHVVSLLKDTNIKFHEFRVYNFASRIVKSSPLEESGKLIFYFWLLYSSLRTCLSYEWIPCSTDLSIFMGKKNLASYLSYKSEIKENQFIFSFSERERCRTKQQNSGLHGKSKQFPLHCGILSSHKHTLSYR